MRFSKFFRLCKIAFLTSWFLLILSACSDSQIYLFKNLTEENSTEITLLLGENNIKTFVDVGKDGGYNLAVLEKNKIPALTILAQNGLPKKPLVSLGDEFKKDGFISSPMEEQARYVYALQQEIAHTLMQINGVISVNVQISLPPPSDNLWQGSVIVPATSVLIKYMPGFRVDLYNNKIKVLVSNSVPGLTPDRVSILLINADSE